METSVQIDSNSRAPIVAGICSLAIAAVHLISWVYFYKMDYALYIIGAVIFVVMAIFLFMFSKKKIKLLVIPLSLLAIFFVYRAIVLYPIVTSFMGANFFGRYAYQLVAFLLLAVSATILIIKLFGKIKNHIIVTIYLGVVLAAGAIFCIDRIVIIINYISSKGWNTTVVLHEFFTPLYIILPAISLLVLSQALPRPSQNKFSDDSVKATTLNRSIGISVLFCFLTFGIYMVYWVYCIAKEIKSLKSDNSSVVGEVVCVFIVPFYVIYWAYTRSASIEEASKEHKVNVSINSVANLVLSIFGFMIIVIALMQNSLNAIFDNDIHSATNEQTTGSQDTKEEAVELLKQINDLHQQGVLSDQEFEEKKKEILTRI